MAASTAVASSPPLQNKQAFISGVFQGIFSFLGDNTINLDKEMILEPRKTIPGNQLFYRIDYRSDFQGPKDPAYPLDIYQSGLYEEKGQNVELSSAKSTYLQRVVTALTTNTKLSEDV